MSRQPALGSQTCHKAPQAPAMIPMAGAYPALEPTAWGGDAGLASSEFHQHWQCTISGWVGGRQRQDRQWTSPLDPNLHVGLRTIATADMSRSIGCPTPLLRREATNVPFSQGVFCTCPALVGCHSHLATIAPPAPCQDRIGPSVNILITNIICNWQESYNCLYSVFLKCKIRWFVARIVRSSSAVEQ